MENSNFIVRIPEPCHQDWNKMTPDANGKYCGSCCKSVIDFSNKTDIEIKTILMERKNEKVCGHFKTSQIDRPLNITIDFNNLPKNMSSTKTFALAVFLVFGTLLFSCTDANAQKVGKIKITKVETQIHMLGEVAQVGQLMVKGDVKAEPDSVIKPIACEQTHIAGGIRFVEEIPEVEKLTGEIAYVPTDSTKQTVALIDTLPTDSIIPEKADSTFHAKLENIIDKSITDNNSDIDNNHLEILAISSYGVYPNPSSGEFTIKYEVLKRANVRVDILDLNGKLVQNIVNVNNQYEGQYQIPVNTNELANGIYLVSLITDGKRMTERLVIEK